MDTFRFGRRLKLPATSSIKHQLRAMMWADEVKKAETEARTKAVHVPRDEDKRPAAQTLTEATAGVAPQALAASRGAA